MASNHLCSPVYGVFQAQKMTSEQHTLPSTIRTSESSNPIPELRYTTGGSGTDTWTASERLRVLGLLRRLTSHRGSHDTSGSTIGLAWPAYRMLKVKSYVVGRVIHSMDLFENLRIDGNRLLSYRGSMIA
eukprot:gb/GECG01003045.1/.p1 GENE.gb/GECG01003045.1/~~gb/GECG01003045.1/.p1  ORF type:complete len:130 (+),score=5.37 gb/GECG01003045.1/:1-390(+)